MFGYEFPLLKGDRGMLEIKIFQTTLLMAAKGRLKMTANGLNPVRC